MWVGQAVWFRLPWRSFGKLPLRYRSIFMKHARHGPRPGKRVLCQTRLGKVEPQTWLLRQREASVHHAHGGESQPLFPDLVGGARLDLTADLLHDKVRHGGIHLQRGQAADGAFAGMWRHRDPRCGGHLRHLPKSRDAADMIDIGMEDIHHPHLANFTDSEDAHKSLPGGNWRGGTARDPGHRLHVLRRAWLLDEQQVQRLYLFP